MENVIMNVASAAREMVRNIGSDRNCIAAVKNSATQISAGGLFVGLLIFGNGVHAEPTLSDNVIRIGVLSDFSGPFSETNGLGSLRATELAVEEFIATTGEKRVEVVFFDHQNKTESASVKAREWFDRGGVDMLVDIQNSAVALAVARIAAEKKKLAIVVGAGSSKIANEDCTPYTVHYAYNTNAMANVAARSVIAQGGKNWYFITSDYAFGHSLEQDASRVIKSLSGDVKGSARHPLNASDFSSFVLQAQASKADVVGLANAGVDFMNALKSAKEFGVSPAQKVVGLMVTINDVHSLGLDKAQGLTVADGWYWDTNEETRAFSQRFFKKMKRMPSMFNAAIYSSTMQYLKAVRAAQNDNADDVMKIMKSTPINDVYAKNGKIRGDGLMVHDMYLYQVKTPTESKYPWDYYMLKATVKGEDAFHPLSESRCPLVAKK